MLWIFIAAAIVGVALGVGLIVNGARTLRFLGAMNRWVSLRSKLKPMEIPRDIGKAVYGHGRWFGGPPRSVAPFGRALSAGRRLFTLGAANWSPRSCGSSVTKRYNMSKTGVFSRRMLFRPAPAVLELEGGYA